MLDSTISFLNEYSIEEEKVYNNIQHMKEIVKGMIYNMDEIMDFYQIIEKFNIIKESTKVTTNSVIITAKENFQNVTSEFNVSVETMEDQFELLMKIMRD